MHDAQFTFIQILTELILLMIFIQHVPGYLPTYWCLMNTVNLYKIANSWLGNEYSQDINRP